MNTNRLLRSAGLQHIKKGILALTIMMATAMTSEAQNNNNNNNDRPVRRSSKAEEFGHTLNIGIGLAYYGYLGSSVPFLGFNYELNVARNFTLAPSIGIASYRSYNDYAYMGSRYYYHETIIPIGLKGTYYFDEILNAGPNWDFYLAASLGFNINRVSWDDGYHGNRDVYGGASRVYLDLHIGAEYHVSRSIGLFLDASSGISTFGLAVHHL